MKNYYCTTCGQPLIVNPLVRDAPQKYNQKTGKPEVRKFERGQMICSTGKCGHWGIDHINKYPTLWDGLFGSGLVTCCRPGCNFSRKMFDGII